MAMPIGWGVSMLSSIYARAGRKTIFLLARCFAASNYSRRPRRPRPVNLIAVALALLPLTERLKTQVALAEPSRAAQRVTSTPQQTLQKKHNEAALMVLAGHPGTPYFNMAHDMAAALHGSSSLRLIAMDA